MGVEPGGASCLMVGLPGPDLDRATTNRLRRLRPAGAILFRRNLVDPDQSRDLLRRVAPLLAGNPLLAVDQEGGRVSRLETWIGTTPSAAALARAGLPTLERFARATGRALRSLGFNLDFAPVVDLSAPDAANGIGDRSFGTDPDVVARAARSCLAGLGAEGIAGCLKHFPGLGAGRVDSHHELPTIDVAREVLARRDLVPFRALSGAAPAVMVGHGHYPALDPACVRPATCSPPVVHRLLREDLGFAGLVVSDDLEMGAVSGRDADGAAAVEALAAGCDLLLYCSDLERAAAAARAIDRAARERTALRRRLAEAAARIAHLAGRWPVLANGPPWNLVAGAFASFRGLA